MLHVDTATEDLRRERILRRIYAHDSNSKPQNLPFFVPSTESQAFTMVTTRNRTATQEGKAVERPNYTYQPPQYNLVEDLSAQNGTKKAKPRKIKPLFIYMIEVEHRHDDTAHYTCSVCHASYINELAFDKHIVREHPGAIVTKPDSIKNPGKIAHDNVLRRPIKLATKKLTNKESSKIVRSVLKTPFRSPIRRGPIKSVGRKLIRKRRKVVISPVKQYFPPSQRSPSPDTPIRDASISASSIAQHPSPNTLKRIHDTYFIGPGHPKSHWENDVYTVQNIKGPRRSSASSEKSPIRNGSKSESSRHHSIIKNKLVSNSSVERKQSDRKMPQPDFVRIRSNSLRGLYKLGSSGLEEPVRRRASSSSLYPPFNHKVSTPGTPPPLSPSHQVIIRQWVNNNSPNSPRGASKVFNISPTGTTATSWPTSWFNANTSPIPYTTPPAWPPNPAPMAWMGPSSPYSTPRSGSSSRPGTPFPFSPGYPAIDPVTGKHGSILSPHRTSIIPIPKHPLESPKPAPGSPYRRRSTSEWLDPALGTVAENDDKNDEEEEMRSPKKVRLSLRGGGFGEGTGRDTNPNPEWLFGIGLPPDPNRSWKDHSKWTSPSIRVDNPQSPRKSVSGRGKGQRKSFSGGRKGSRGSISVPKTPRNSIASVSKRRPSYVVNAERRASLRSASISSLASLTAKSPKSPAERRKSSLVSLGKKRTSIARPVSLSYDDILLLSRLMRH